MRVGWRRHLPYLILLVTGTGLLIVLSLLQHRALGTGYDLGIYDQTIWNLSHGRIWETTLVYETGGFYDRETGERIELAGPGQTLVRVGELVVASP